MRISFFLVALLLPVLTSWGQNAQAKTDVSTASKKTEGIQPDNNFCDILYEFIQEAFVNFEHIKGKELESTNSVVYAALKGFPGTITSSIINDSDWYYEGVLYQGKSKDEMAKAYRNNDASLDICLLYGAYKTFKGIAVPVERVKELDSFPSTSYTTRGENDIMVHTGLKVDYSSFNEIYTVILYVKKETPKKG